jgi:tRNA modification GTPase
VTASTALAGWPVEFADTAGVRESRDPLEAAGVGRTRLELQTADVAILVFDAAQPWSPEDESLCSAAPAALVVHNKCDLVATTSGDRPCGVSTSALVGVGLDELKEAIVARIAPRAPPPGAAVPFTHVHCEALREAKRLIDVGQPLLAARPLRTLLSGGRAQR